MMCSMTFMSLQLEFCSSYSLIWVHCLNLFATQYIQVEEKLESGQGKTTFRRFFSRFCTPIFLEVCCFATCINLLVSFSICYSGLLILAHMIHISFLSYIENHLIPMTPLAVFITNILFLILQSFVLTFLAEWGDRSQIATIAVRYDLVIVHFMFCEDFCN